MDIPFIKPEIIRKYASETLGFYETKKGKKIKFPLDAEDIFYTLFGLETIYDDKGVINKNYGRGIIGCLYPDGHVSPWGKDKLIVVNATEPEEIKRKDRKIVINLFDPTAYNDNFTITHEGGGHYILHFLKGITGKKINEAFYCRGEDMSPLEWQANRFAGELLMPADKVRWLLDGKDPGECVLLQTYGKMFREFFNASQGMMEKRLVDLGYKLLDATYKWANYIKQQKT